jgi:hypothetical protein
VSFGIDIAFLGKRFTIERANLGYAHLDVRGHGPGEHRAPEP